MSIIAACSYRLTEVWDIGPPQTRIALGEKSIVVDVSIH